MRTHENSLEAYAAILDGLPRARRAVMETVISAGYPLTRNQISDRMNKPINHTSPRVRELLDVGLLVEVGNVEVENKHRALLAPGDGTPLETPPPPRDVGKFLEEIRAVCRKHGLQIAVGQYDCLQVWPLADGEDEIHAAGIENMVGRKGQGELFQ